MLFHFLKIAARQLRKTPVFACINILGMAIGLTFVLLIGLYIYSEFQVNKELKNLDQQYILQSEWKKEGIGLPFTTLAPLPKALRDEYPHLVKDFYRIHGITSNISVGEKSFREEVQVGDPSLISMYGIPLLEGDEKAMTNPQGVVLMDKLAEKLFGRTNVLGETVTIETPIAQADSEGKKDYIVTGVLQSAPMNSVVNYFEGDCTVFLSMENMDYFGGKDADESWPNIAMMGFVELAPGVTPDQLTEPMARLLKTHAPARFSDNLTPVLRPLHDYYLQESDGQRMRMIYTLGAIALLILFMAAVNFINISIGRAGVRLKEIGVRKALGGLRSQLMFQFLAESCLQTLFAFAIALGLAELLLPTFRELVGKPLGMEYMPWGMVWPLLLTISLLTGLLAGIYPAVVLSGLRPVQSLKGKLHKSPSGQLLRRSLLVIQFGLALFLLASLFVVNKQVAYFFNQDLGYDANDVLVVSSVPRAWDRQGYEKLAAQKQSFEEVPEVASVSMSFEIPDGRFGMRPAIYAVGQSAEDAPKVSPIFCDEAYAETFGLRLKEGHFFEGDSRSHRPMTLLVNENMAQQMGWEEPIGKQLMIQGWSNPWEVVGVVQDYHFASFHDAISPVVFIHNADWTLYRYLSFRFEKGQAEAGKKAVEEVWRSTFPAVPFVSFLMQEKLESLYHIEIRLGKAASVSTWLGLLIVLLGVFGLILQNLAYRRKEISIRKILGASLRQLIGLLGREFAVLFVIASAISLPLAYLLMQDWLEGFVYKTTPGWTAFGGAAVLVLTLVSLLISLQLWQAGRRNPVDALREE